MMQKEKLEVVIYKSSLHLHLLFSEKVKGTKLGAFYKIRYRTIWLKDFVYSLINPAFCSIRYRRTAVSARVNDFVGYSASP